MSAPTYAEWYSFESVDAVSGAPIYVTIRAADIVSGMLKMHPTMTAFGVMQAFISAMYARPVGAPEHLAVDDIAEEVSEAVRKMGPGGTVKFAKKVGISPMLLIDIMEGKRKKVTPNLLRQLGLYKHTTIHRSKAE